VIVEHSNVRKKADTKADRNGGLDTGRLRLV